MADPGRSNGGDRARRADDSNGARGFEFQPSRSEQEEGGTRARDGRDIPIPSASELLWVLLVGIGNADGVGESSLLGRLRGGAVALFQEED